MNNNRPTHEALVDAIYESALNPVKWKDTLNGCEFVQQINSSNKEFSDNTSIRIK